MNNSDIVVDSNDISDIVSTLNSNVQLLNSISNKLLNSFYIFNDLSLFQQGFDKLNSKVLNLKEINENLINAISGQTIAYNNVENMISNLADDYMSYYNDNGNVVTNNTNSTNIATLNDAINNLSDNDLIKIINYINITKNKEESFSDILVNTSLLNNHLNTYYKDNYNVDLSTTDEKKLKDQFIVKLLNTGMDMPANLKENSLLEYKEYFTSITNELNISFYDLLFSQSYLDVRNLIFTDLYNGSAIGDTSLLSDNYLEKFKFLLEERSKKYNVSVTGLLKNPILLI